MLGCLEQLIRKQYERMAGRFYCTLIKKVCLGDFSFLWKLLLDKINALQCFVKYDKINYLQKLNYKFFNFNVG